MTCAHEEGPPQSDPYLRACCCSCWVCRTVDLELLLQKREAAAGLTTTFMQAVQQPPPPMAADRDSLPPASSLQVDTSPFAALTAVALLHHQLSSSSSDPAPLCDRAAFPPFPLGDHRFAPSAMADGSMADMAGEDDRSRSSAGPFQRSRSSSSERLSLSGPPTDRGLPDLPHMSAGGFGDAGGGPGGKRISRACQRCHDMKGERRRLRSHHALVDALLDGRAHVCVTDSTCTVQYRARVAGPATAALGWGGCALSSIPSLAGREGAATRPAGSR